MAIWPFKSKEKIYNSVPQGYGYKVLEAFAGAWQRNIEYKRQDVLAFHAVFSCVSLIASDISKLNINLVRGSSNDIWVKIPYDNYRVIVKPNDYQNRIQFYETWILSKLIRGNAYIFKQRDNRGNVVELHVLHPDRVLPLVSDDGQVFYQLGGDNLSGISEVGITVPASEIIHDRFNCFFHPLVGLSPLFASGLPAYMGLQIMENGSRHFKNGGRPSGILTIPEAITKEKALELSQQWESKYGGENYGKTAILGGDLKYQPLSMTAVESQMVEQLKLSAEMVCSTFHVPAYKILGNAPSYNNIEALDQAYYSQCLQVLIESIELCLDENLDISEDKGTEFDLDGLLRMDKKSQIETLGTGITKAIISPNEARRKLNMGPVAGGDTPYLQEQNYSLEALSKRDAMEDPFNKSQTQTSTPEPEQDRERSLMLLSMAIKKELLDA